MDSVEVTNINSEMENSSDSPDIAVNLEHANLTTPTSPENHTESSNIAVTNQPQPNANQLTSQIFADDGEETEDSFRAAEFYLAEAHLREATGFQLKYTWMPCCPSLEIKPTLGQGMLGVPVEEWKIVPESEGGCYCCFFPRARQWKTMKFMQNGREILNFIYRPEIWYPGQKKECVVDIYIPGRTKRIGWIKYNSGCDFEESNAVVADTITKSVFRISKRVCNTTIAIRISNNVGTVLPAVAYATRGWRRRFGSAKINEWTEFDMKFAPPVLVSLQLSATTKAVILVAYTMWVLQYRERITRRKCYIAAMVLIMSTFVSSLIIAFQSS